MNRDEYRKYILKELKNYLDIDIGTLKDSDIKREVGFFLEYLDDHLLINPEDALTYEEKKYIVCDYMNNLTEQEKIDYMEIYFNVFDGNWNMVNWDLYEIEYDQLYLYLSMDSY